MLEFLANLNWTALIMTVVICTTALRLAEHLRSLAKIWLEGLRTERDIQEIVHGKKGQTAQAATGRQRGWQQI